MTEVAILLYIAGIGMAMPFLSEVMVSKPKTRVVTIVFMALAWPIYGTMMHVAAAYAIYKLLRYGRKSLEN